MSQFCSCKGFAGSKEDCAVVKSWLAASSYLKTSFQGVLSTQQYIFFRKDQCINMLKLTWQNNAFFILCSSFVYVMSKVKVSSDGPTKKEWWRVKGGRAVRRPPAVFGNAYFSFWLERLSLPQFLSRSIKKRRWLTACWVRSSLRQLICRTSEN